MVLTSTPSGSSTCTSTSGTNTPFTSNSATCTSFPGGGLSAGYEATLPVTLASAGTVGPSTASLASGATGLQTAPDISGFGDDGFALGGVTFNASGPLSGLAASFDGSSGMLETPQLLTPPPANITLSAWVKVASGYSSGGGILGRENAQNGSSTPTSWAPLIWMDNSGNIAAGEYTGSTVETVVSSGTYNDGNWHYVVASFSSSTGLTLYVDGSSVGTNSGATAMNTTKTAYWTIGYVYGSSYTPTPSSYYLNGQVAEAAVFYSTLSSAAVTTLYNSGGGTEAAFETRVLADSPRLFWPLQAPSSTTNLPDLGSLPDVSGNNDAATPEAGVTPSDAGPFSNDGAIYLDGATDGTSEVETATSNAALPSSFSIAAWFRAPSGLSTGGGIVSFDTAQAGGGSGHDPLVWMDNSGKLVAGTYGSAQQEVTSSATYNDGNWHFVVATVSSAGLKLYVDGSLITTNSSGTSGGSLGGYWLIGYGDLAAWADPPTSDYWTGDLAHVAYFASALSAAQISTLYAAKSSGLTTYEADVLADSPTYYWPLTDSGTSETESFPFFEVEPDLSSSNDDGTAVGSTVTLGVPGPLSGYAAGFTGSTGYLETGGAIASGSAPDTFSLVAYFKAPSHATGGGIIGYDNTQDGTGASHDRMIWMDNSGKLVAGISGGNGVEATSTSTYDNNAWHLAVAVFTPSTLTLYVDGSQVATVSSGISDLNYAGYWTVGFNHESGTWADQATNEEWTGSLADVAVIPSALSSATDTTLYGEASQGALSTELLSLSPSEFWPLSSLEGAPTEAGGLELTVQNANNGTTSCLIPSGSGSCPASTQSDYIEPSTTLALTAPSAAHSTTVTLGVEMPSSPPALLSNLHFNVPLTFSGALTGSAWTASLAYPYINFQY
jgi:hypothetical protein